MSKTSKDSALNLDSEWGTFEAKRFRDLALRYQEIAALGGVKLTPLRSPEMPMFAKATPEERKTATDFLESIVSIHEETLAALEEPINTQQLLWRALRQFSLVPSADIFNQITNEDVILIYNESQTAVFWNLQFFKFSSLSVEDLFFGHWYKFTKRDPAIQEKLYEMALNIISGKINGIFRPEVPPHIVEEVDTLECVKTMMELPGGSVLTKNGKVGGILVIQRMRIIE